MRAQSPHAIQQAAIRCSIAAHNVEAPHEVAQAHQALLLTFPCPGRAPQLKDHRAAPNRGLHGRRSGAAGQGLQCFFDASLRLRKLPDVNALEVLADPIMSFTLTLL